MGCGLSPQTPWPVPEDARGRPWGGINLGDEATAVVFVNLTCRRMDAELRHRFPDRPPAATVGELVERFLRAFPDYPPVRLALEPGEGYRLPRDGLIVGGSPEGKQEPDVFLLIHGGDGTPASGIVPSVAEAGDMLRCVGEGIWLTGRLLRPHECPTLIAAAEAEGFRSAHQKADGRNNSEVFFDHRDLSETILARLGERARGAGFEVVAVAPHFEWYRYEEGDYVGAHRDAAVEISPHRPSDLSLVVYLNEDFQAGETRFPDQTLSLRPAAGEGILFRHSLLHEGTAVRQGRKYIVRTSVAVSPVVQDGVHAAPRRVSLL
jgi:prolyl 4-hydroxylase